MKKKNLLILGLTIIVGLILIAGMNIFPREYLLENVGFSIFTTTSNSSGSTPIPSTSYEVFLDDECIMPLEGFSYKTQDSELPRAGLDFVITPIRPWLSVVNLPTSNINAPSLRQKISIIRSIHGETEIWIENYEYTTSETLNFIIYNPKSNGFREINAKVISQNSSVYVTSLFLQGETLWGHNKQKSVSPLSETNPLLSRFNETIQEFELDNGSNSKFGTKNYKFLISEEKFWFLVSYDGIYSYSPLEQEFKKYLDVPEHNIMFSTISPDGEIYYIESHIPSERSIYSINISNQDSGVKALDLTYSVDISLFSNIFADHLGQLWIGGLGWRDQDKQTWYKLYPSPIFISTSPESGATYWQNPFLITESSDGRLWFRSDNGMAWLDLKKEQWCWFTTYQSNIVEDSENNLWMIADGKLYKLPLSEQ